MVTETKQFCHQCGSEIIPGDSFCQDCGAKVLSLADAVAPEVTPPPQNTTTFAKPNINISLKPLKYFLIIAVLALVGVFAYPLIFGGGVMANWSSLRGNAANTGASTTGPKPPLKLLWSAKNTGPSPKIANGTVYIAKKKGDHYYLYALGAKTGAEKWHARGENDLGLFSTVANKTVYTFGQNKANNHVYLYALNTKSGRIKWRTRNNVNLFGFFTVVANGIIYTTGGDINKNHIYLYALDAKSGRVKWRTRSLSEFAFPTVANGIAYITKMINKHSYLYALDAKSGRIKWRKGNSGDLGGFPTVANGTIYTWGGEGNENKHAYIYALDAKSGTEKWRKQIGKDIPTSQTGLFSAAFPAIAGNTVYAMGIKNEHIYLYALDAKSGRIKWRRKISSSIASAPSITNGIVYVVGIKNNHQYLYALDAKSGEEKWRSNRLSRTDGEYLVSTADGVVVVSSEEKTYVFGK